MHISKEVQLKISKNSAELKSNNHLFGGVFIDKNDRSINVCGADNLDVKNIFFINTEDEEYEDILDIETLLRNTLEEEGINVISEADFHSALNT